MPSDAGAGAAHLADVLARAAGAPPPTPAELADLLWLAHHLPAPTPRQNADSPAPLRDAGNGAPAKDAGNGAASPHRPAPDASPHPDTPEAPTPDAPPAHPRVPLHLPATDPARQPSTDTTDTRDRTDTRSRRDTPGPTYTTLLAPAPPMLAHPLELQRALRPLKRRVPAPVGQELDEAATAHRIARLGAAPQWWLPVLRPLTERWLTLHLVHDTGPTMPVWRPLVRELHTALAQSGIFRTVELHRLETDGTVRRPGSQESFADGRTVTLLISDCMGPQWRDGPAGTRWYATLRRWSASMPVALVQPLPERLWRTTALPATTARITAPGPAAPNSAYGVDAYALEDLPREVLALPVLEASAPWLANWSSLVAGRGRLPGAVALLGTAPPAAPVDERGRSDVERLSAEELLLRFRSLASPEAFRLAGHLAVGPPELSVMRLVQAAIEKNPQPQHLAEVILSGALTAVPGTAGSYAFRPGVRELLLRTLPRTARGRTSELLARVGALIDARAGVAAGEFRVAVPGPGSATAGGEPFAAVREESVRRLGGTPPHQTRPAAGAQSPSAPRSATPPPAPQSPRPSRPSRPTRQSGRQASAQVTGPADRRPDEAADALVRAPYVLIGFDGPLVRLYTGDGERQATRELAALLAELRDPQAALSGEPLSPGGAPAPPLEGRANPLDLLRAVAGHPLGADLRRRLNRIEERAVSTAASTPFSDALITTLSSLGRRTAVVADNAPSAVWKYLQAHGRLTGLVTGGVHGRSDDLTRLMPDPDCLLRALAHLGAAPKDAVLVGSSVAELTAAKAVGLRFLGYTRSEPHRRRLVSAGCELTTASWAPLLRALPPT